MNITEYFIKHPVSAIVLNVMLILFGVLCMNGLQIREYPEVYSTKINITTIYRNASSDLVESGVTNVLEDLVAGIKNVDHVASHSASGVSIVKIKFNDGAIAEDALNAVKDAIFKAKNRLPKDVETPEVKYDVGDNDTFMFIGVLSNALPNVAAFQRDKIEFAKLVHYANLNLKNIFRSIPGISEVAVWGSGYMYDISFDHKKMHLYGINADEIYERIATANISIPTGTYQDEASTSMRNVLDTEKDYKNIVIRKTASNTITLGDVADVQLTIDEESQKVKVNGKPGLCIAIKKVDDANPIDVSNNVLKKLESLSLPNGISLELIQDGAAFVRNSVSNIKSTIVEAVISVLIIVFIFLRDGRATIIPLVAIPVSLLGSMILLKIFGYSINIITLLAMVLAVGLVVDDAIVMLENIQKHIEQGQNRLAATISGAKEVGFAIVAMTCTLASVYLPLAFIPGNIGKIFSEFAIALAGSVLISGITALTLSPLMCAKLLSNNTHHHSAAFDRIMNFYRKILSKVIHYPKICIGVMVCTVIVTILLAKMLPSFLVPRDDHGIIGLWTEMPSWTKNVIEFDKVVSEKVVPTYPNIPEAVKEISFMGEWGMNQVWILQDKKDRKRSGDEIVNNMRMIFKGISSMDVYPWSATSRLPGVSVGQKNSSSVACVISTTKSYRDLYNTMTNLVNFIQENYIDKGGMIEEVEIENLDMNNLVYRIDVNHSVRASLGIELREIGRAIEMFFSGSKNIDFDMNGVSYRIFTHGDIQPWDLNGIYVTNKDGAAISLGVFAKMVEEYGPNELYHYNQMRSAKLRIGFVDGVDSGSSIKLASEILRDNLPNEYRMTWGQSEKAHRDSERTMVILFGLSVVFIYAVLSVQFGNFIDPLVILFTVPLACCGAILFAFIFKQSMNIYTQVGLITLVGLITKHGILIVEFANQLHAANKDRSWNDIIIDASSMRFRAIIMTTGAMIFGAIPMVLSHNSGYEVRMCIGVVLIGGLLFGTIFTLFILPTVLHMRHIFCRRLA